MSSATDDHLRAATSQEQWRAVRHHLNAHRHDLSRRATALYHDEPSVCSLITPDGWSPPAPIALEQVKLAWSDAAPSATLTGSEPETIPVRPARATGQRYPTYADALADLDRPTLFEDRPSYRLVHVAVDDGSARLTFGRAAFFDIINICEAAAHEFAQAAMDGPGTPSAESLAFRSLIGDPADLGRRPIIPAISVLTIRRSARDGATFVLHRRDAAKVAHAGGLYQVMPVGIFQPSAPEPWNEGNDFDLFRSIAREYSEEFLGESELAGHDQPIAYSGWPFFASLQNGRRDGDLQMYWLGTGIDPLSLVVDLLVVAVFDDQLFDDLFIGLVTANAEGTVVRTAGAGPHTTGIPFGQDTVTDFVDRRPMQAAGRALLHLAWRHRKVILG